MHRVMGLDVGDKTVGIAVSDALGITAQGLPTLMRKNLEADLDALALLCQEHQVERVVVGLPLNMDGTEGFRAQISRQFAQKLEKKTGLPMEFWDERLTTAQVERVLLEANVSRQKRRKVVDKLAAQVILQAWVDAHSSPVEMEED